MSAALKARIQRRALGAVWQTTHDRQRGFNVGQRLGEDRFNALPSALGLAKLGMGAGDWIVTHLTGLHPLALRCQLH